MAAPTNTTTSADMNAALDVEFIRTFNSDYNQLADILGIVTPEIVPAGQALYSVKIAGEAVASGYTEGDAVPISKYTIQKEAIGEVAIQPYRKRTTAQAVLKSGYERAILRTDAKMLSDIRGGVVDKFVKALAAGTGTASGKTLQDALVKADAALADAMEKNNDGYAGEVVHVVNRQDAAEYLGTAPVTTQNMFGLTYLESFLGIGRVILTSKTPAKTVYAVPTSNIHVYGADLSTLAQSGLVYRVSDNGLIGVAHTPDYGYASAETHVMTGLLIHPEVKDYIVKGTIAPKA